MIFKGKRGVNNRGEYDAAHTCLLCRLHEADAHLGLVLLENRRDIERTLDALKHGLEPRPVPQIAQNAITSAVGTRLLRFLHRTHEPQGMDAPAGKRWYNQPCKAAGRANDKSASRVNHLDLLSVGNDYIQHSPALNR